MLSTSSWNLLFEVGCIVGSLEHTERTGIDRGVGVIDVADLKIHLKTSSSLVPSKLDPYLTVRDCARLVDAL